MLRRIWKFVILILKRFFEEGGPIKAAGLSYISLLSVVPLMTVSFSVLTAFPVFRGLDMKLQKLIFSNFVASSAQVVQHYLNSFVGQVSRLSGPGLAFLFVTAVFVIFATERVFNHIWRVEKRRNAVQAFLMYWAILTLTPLFLGVGLVVSSYLMGLSFTTGVVAISLVKKNNPYYFPLFLYLFCFYFIICCGPKL